MKKNCVFCGLPLEGKTKEHVLPQWLLKLTGDPNRTVNIGMDWKNGKPIRFAFNRLTVPACGSCNEEFAELESRTKPIIERLLNHTAVTGDDFITLLDWLDKVRVGLWINEHYFNKTPFVVDPKFGVKKRLAAKDRMLALYRLPDQQKGLQISAASSFVFQYQPSCFGLRINDLFFFNMSSDFLFSKRAGFPYPKVKYSQIGGDLHGTLNCSDFDITRRLQHPIIRRHIHEAAIEIYQPIMIPAKMIEYQDGTEPYIDFEDPYIIEGCLPPDAEGKGKLLRQYSDKVIRIEDMSLSVGFPTNRFAIFSKPVWKLTKQVMDHRMHIYRESRCDGDDKEMLRLYLEEKKRVMHLDRMISEAFVRDSK